MPDEGTQEQSPVITEKKITEILPEASWVNEEFTVQVVDTLPNKHAGEYDLETKEVRISLESISNFADDVYEAKSKTKAEEVKEKINKNWTSYDDETKKSALATYLYLRALNRSFNSYETLKNGFETEVAAHEARHAYDDLMGGYSDKTGEEGLMELLALSTQLEESPVFERNLFVLCIEPYWSHQTEGYEPESINKVTGIALTKLMLGHEEATNLQLKNSSLPDRLKHIAFLPEEDIKALCGNIKERMEQKIYSPEILDNVKNLSE